MPFFHCSSTLLDSGSIIRPGNWGRVIGNVGWTHSQAFKEATLDYVRQKEFADKPSRMMTSFFFDDQDEALFYAASDGRGVTMMAYEVELLDPEAPRHAGDWRSVNPRGAVDLNWACEYWQGLYQSPPPSHPKIACREIIAVTRLKIVRRI